MRHLAIGNVAGLSAEDAEMLKELVEVFNYHQVKNKKKQKYYEGHIKVRDVNLGIALPESLNSFEVGCEWGTKCVDKLAAKSIFQGFVSESGKTLRLVNALISNNKLLSEYKKATKDELTYGCTFVTLSADKAIGCKIRMHSPLSAAALWDGENNRIKCGLAIIDSLPDEKDEGKWYPSLVNMYTDTHIIVLRREGQRWEATPMPHKMGRPLMEPLIWKATSQKPFGQSRIKFTERGLIDGNVRTIVDATIGLEFATSPQKYLLGVSDEQYDALIDNKFKQYVGSLLMATTNPETGSNPQFGQLQQGSIQPHVDMMRILATQFAAVTGLTVTDVGVINDANPTSSDAIIAQSDTLIDLAEELNQLNGEAMETVMRMACCIALNCNLETMPEEVADIVAHFRNPAMPSLSATADAAVKIATSREGFANTDIYLEMLGFDQADIRRIKSQENRAKGELILTEEFEDADLNEGMDGVHPEDVENQPNGG